MAVGANERHQPEEPRRCQKAQRSEPELAKM
jgi:hypothetical protein